MIQRVSTPDYFFTFSNYFSDLYDPAICRKVADSGFENLAVNLAPH